MAILEIDGIGKVEVGNEFLSLSPDRQAAEVDAIIAQIKPQAVPAQAPDVPGRPAVAAASAAPAPDGSAVSRVLSRAGEVAGAAFGDAPFGFSEESIKQLRDMGVLTPAGRAATPIQLLNEVVVRFGAQAGDAILRTIAGGVGAVAGAAGQTVDELGLGGARGGQALTRDIMQLPQAIAPEIAGPAALTRRAAASTVARTERAVPAAETVETISIKAPAGGTEFKTAARSFYKDFEDAGVVVKPESYKALSDDIFQTAAKNRLDPTLTPGSTAAVKRIQELADPRVGPISFETLDTMRQLAGDARTAAKAGSNDARVAGIIIDKIDDFIDRVKPADILAGDAKAAAAAIPKARDLWSRAKKLDTITDLVSRAEVSAGGFAQSGFENALRTEFRTLAKSKERMKGFSADEQKAIKLVAVGGRGGNIARAVGRLAPRGSLGTFLSGSTGATIGASIIGGGIGAGIGAGTAFAIGEAGRRIATALIQRNIRNLESTIRAGGESPMERSAIQRSNTLLAALQDVTLPAAIAQESR